LGGEGGVGGATPSWKHLGDVYIIRLIKFYLLLPPSSPRQIFCIIWRENVNCCRQIQYYAPA
jgi:hypothetical protein